MLDVNNPDAVYKRALEAGAPAGAVREDPELGPLTR